MFIAQGNQNNWSLGWGGAQGWSSCLACPRPWDRPPAGAERIMIFWGSFPFEPSGYLDFLRCVYCICWVCGGGQLILRKILEHPSPVLGKYKYTHTHTIHQVPRYNFYFTLLLCPAVRRRHFLTLIIIGLFCPWKEFCSLPVSCLCSFSHLWLWSWLAALWGSGGYRKGHSTTSEFRVFTCQLLPDCLEGLSLPSISRCC
jgi:hypothetical protein